jgi:hypothetical protein
MHAKIERYDLATAPPDAVITTGRRLAARLNGVRGFVAYLLLDAGDGAFVGVSIFEDEAGLAEDTALLGHSPTQQDGMLSPRPTRIVSGEVVVQKGL